MPSSNAACALPLPPTRRADFALPRSGGRIPTASSMQTSFPCQRCAFGGPNVGALWRRSTVVLLG